MCKISFQFSFSKVYTTTTITVLTQINMFLRTSEVNQGYSAYFPWSPQSYFRKTDPAEDWNGLNNPNQKKGWDSQIWRLTQPASSAWFMLQLSNTWSVKHVYKAVGHNWHNKGSSPAQSRETDWDLWDDWRSLTTSVFLTCLKISSISRSWQTV